MDRFSGTNYDIDGAGHRVFRDANLGANIRGSFPNAQFLTGVQEELLKVIEGFGLVANSADNTQLYQALLKQFGARYAWNAATPPGADVSLAVGDKATITFSAVSSLPFKIATVQGAYAVRILTSADNTTGEGPTIQPNNTTSSNAFSLYAVTSTDLTLSAVGNATTQPNFVINTVSPYVSNIPINQASRLNLPSFFLDVFDGPQAVDTIHGRGACTLDLLVNTTTLAKSIYYRGGVRGGTVNGMAIWEGDTTTAWTSFGTFYQANSTSFTGVALIERLV